MNAVFPPDVRQFVAQQISAGRYPSEDELVIDAVRRLRDDEKNMHRFRSQLQDRLAALDRGEGIVLESDEQLGAFLDQIDGEVDAESGQKQVAT